MFRLRVSGLGDDEGWVAMEMIQKITNKVGDGYQGHEERIVASFLCIQVRNG